MNHNPGGIMEPQEQKKIKALFEIWKKKKFDLNYYFKKIFSHSLRLLSENIEKSIRDDVAAGKYKSLFMPVGYSIENIVLVAAFLHPVHLTLGFSEITQKFHNRHFPLVNQTLKNDYPNMSIDKKEFRSTSYNDITNGITEWVKNAQYSHSELAIDLTGGTKPMAIGAQTAAIYFKDIDAFYLYVDYDEGTHQPIPGTEKLIKLGKAGFNVDKTLVFVLLPNKENYNKIYKWIYETVTACGLTCIRVEKEVFTDSIMEKIRENIYKAGIIITDTTEHNPNVYYELGIAHEAGKQVILLTQNPDTIPFDIKLLRHLSYKPVNKQQFIRNLGREINSLKID